MKKQNFILAIIVLFSLSKIQAQNENKISKFDIYAYGGIGYTQVKNDNEPDYDLNVNTGEIILNYKAWEKIGLATGIGYSVLSGNGFNSNGNFYQKRNLIKIPLLLTINSNISENLIFTGNFGLYGQTIVKDEFQYNDKTETDVYEGINFGAQLGFGIGYQLDERLGFGINFNGQSDFNSFETNNNSTLNDKQRHKNFTSIGIFARIKL